MSIDAPDTRKLDSFRLARQGTFQDAMRYRSALGFWHANRCDAARRREEFVEPRPQAGDFIREQDPR